MKIINKIYLLVLIFIVVAIINITLLYQSGQLDNSQSHSIIKTRDIKVQVESISGLVVSIANGNVKDEDNLNNEIENIGSILTMLKNGGVINKQPIQKIPTSITSDYNKLITSWNTYKEKISNIKKTSVFDKEATHAINYVLQKNSDLVLSTNAISKELSDLGRDYNRHKEIAKKLENSAKEIGQLTLLISIGVEENAQERLKKERIGFEIGLQKLLGISTKDIDVKIIGQEHEEFIQIPRENSGELQKLDPLWEALQPKIRILEERALLSPNFNSAKNEMVAEKVILFSEIDNLLNSWNSEIVKNDNQKQSIVQILLIIDILIFFLVLYVIRQSLLSLRLITNALSEIQEGTYDEQIKYTKEDELGKSFQSLLDGIKASKELHFNAEAKYKNIYENSPDLHRTINKDGIILSCNNSYAKQFEYTKDEIIGFSIYKFIAEKSIDELKKIFHEWSTKGTTSSNELWFKTKSGKIFPALISANNIYDKKGDMIGSNSIIKDISEFYHVLEADEAKKNIENEIEQIKKVNQNKDEFLAMITHELKTPLVPIQGYADILLTEHLGKLTDEQKKRINIIKSSAKSLLAIISDLLDAQKLELGQLKIRKENTNIKDTVKNAIEVFLPHALRNNIEIISYVQDCSIKHDSERIKQVVVNLIKNSLTAVNPGKGIIEISMKNLPQEIHISVKDNGIGIPINKQGNLFKKFYQVDTTLIREKGGSGLGLSICKGIIKNHGGVITVSSILNQETTFTFILPKKQSQKSPIEFKENKLS